MTFDLAKIMQSKRKLRERLAAQSIEEKLAILDALRERALVLQAPRPGPQPRALRETPAACLSKETKSE